MSTGYEIGPIRPPSEWRSLLVRLTRNCPWNRCAFCPVYKSERFEARPVDDVLRDVGEAARIHGDAFESAFLQDADSLVMPAAEVARVLAEIKRCFPRIERITTYARSSTLAKMPLADLEALKDAGLARVHVGLESGSMAVLRMVRKGASPRVHIDAGLKVKAAGLSLSEYVMPGLGGARLWEQHARDTAAVLNAIDPDFIRLRTLFVVPGTALDDARREGLFEAMTDDGIIREIRLFVLGLEGIHSRIASDHSLNLLMELKGRLPGDKAGLLGVADGYLALPDRDRLLFRLGRRVGMVRGLGDLDDVATRARLDALAARIEGEGGAEEVIAALMGRLI